ncbi:DUF58 domain-containing protein [Caldibacillus lycopersici]|uniref:DUF58 domain-containing protein n=1 Tax=Perspicuibacillus lycopersici TaxID=1325689 RepID=A0AAE3LS14_9BACI|nr:DUF58 domain-containing protein [Perspicuibacillus lycopersici]MCU9612283.1 DUF58 domain-containing protein [Perspicuibacillus lycopersici]
MIWRKQIIQEQRVSLVSTLVFLSCVIGFIFISSSFVFVGLLYGMALFMNYLYGKYSGNSLIVQNDKIRHRYFIGEEGSFVLKLQNESLPIINGMVEIWFNKNLTPLHSKNKYEEDKQTMVEIPITIKKGEALHISVPFITKKRGVGRITNIVIQYPNLFGMGKISLTYSPHWQEEFLVLPKIIPVEKMYWQSFYKEGLQSSTSSIFEDRLLTVGTRNYVATDAFHTVHWKASAKMNQLQTKIFEKTTDYSILFLLNIAEGFWFNENIEQIISNVAYLGQIAQKDNIPVALAVNIRSYTNMPFLYLPIGEGKEQFKKLLEMLAVIDTHQLIIPYEQVLHYLLRHRLLPPYIIHAGLLEGKISALLHNMKNTGAVVSCLETNEHHSILRNY